MMAVSTGYDYGIRKGLTDKGIDNSQIGYNPTNQTVTVNGNPFMRADKNYQGAAYTNQNNFNTAWNNYQNSLKQAQQTSTPAASTQQYTPTTQGTPYNYNAYTNNQGINNNPYSSQAAQVIQQLLNYSQNQPAFDPYSSSAYQAAQAQAGRAAQQNTRAAQEAYGSAGFGRSTALGERVAGINNDATEYLMTQVIPQIEAQEQARRQQEYNNQLAALQQLIGQQSRADNLVQQDFNNRITESGLTGNYVRPEAEALIDELLKFKGDTEANWATMTPEQRAASRTQGDTYRNQLQSLGYDPAMFGADVNAAAAQVNKGSMGQTLAGKESAQRIKESNLNAARQVGQDTGKLVTPQDDWSGLYRQGTDPNTPDNMVGREFAEGNRRYNQDFQYTAGRDKVKDEQFMMEFNHQVEQNGIKNALDWAGHMLNQDKFDDSSALDWSKLDWDMMNGGTTPKSTFTPQQVYSAITRKYPNFFKPDKTGIVGNPTEDQLKTIYNDVVRYGLDEKQENDILRSIGLTDEQIAAYDKEFLEESGN